MGAVKIYKEEVVSDHIVCDCGYESEVHEHTYGDFGPDVGEPWTCPECGETFDLDEDWES